MMALAITEVNRFTKRICHYDGWEQGQVGLLVNISAAIQGQTMSIQLPK